MPEERLVTKRRLKIGVEIDRLTNELGMSIQYYYLRMDVRIGRSKCLEKSSSQKVSAIFLTVSFSIIKDNKLTFSRSSSKLINL